MSKIQSYTQKIKKIDPNLRIDSIDFNQEGQYNDVLIVNQSFIFRFAKVPDAIKTLHQEVTVQQKLKDHLSIKIPKPLYINIKPEVLGEVFVGYTMIPGKPLWRDQFQKITNGNTKQKIATQLATFLKELHHPSVLKVISEDLSQSDTQEEWIDLYRQVREKLYSFMRPDALLQVADHFEKHLGNSEQSFFEPRVRHGDFGTGNIIYNPESLSIEGIIDFGNVAVGDPASDFAGLLSSYGEDFYKQCSSIYPAMEQAYDRVKFYCGTFALQEALFGFENDDQEAFQAGIKDYL